MGSEEDAPELFVLFDKFENADIERLALHFAGLLISLEFHDVTELLEKKSCRLESIKAGHQRGKCGNRVS